MSVAKVYIYGEVNAGMVEMVKAQLDNTKDLESIVEYYNTVGGYVEDGEKLRDLLLSYKVHRTSVLPANIGKSMSIATIPYITADKRIAYRSAGDKAIMMHLPFLDSRGHKLNADQLQQYSSQLKAMENSIIKAYSENTTWDKATIKANIQQDRYLGLDEAKEIGFLTEIVDDGQSQPLNNYRAVAKLRTINKTDKMEDKDNKNVLNQIKDLLGIKPAPKAESNIDPVPMAAMFWNSTGQQVIFKDLEDGENPKVGKYATIDNVPITGEQIMPGYKNQTFVFDKGYLKEMKETPDYYKKFAAVSEEKNELDKSLLAARKELTDVKAEMQKKEEDHNRALLGVKEALENYKAKFEGKGVDVVIPEANTNELNIPPMSGARRTLERIKKNQNEKLK